jgi:putative flippase GtrA
VVSRWFKFNFVGAIGIAVQMAAFAFFFGVAGLDKLWATALAVETAVLHNFIWHENFTWKHLPDRSVRAAAYRLLRFHAGNGLVSIAGNVMIVRLLSGALHVSAYLANVVAITICAVLNFAISEWFVFA